jgi:hypothetical protein
MMGADKFVILTHAQYEKGGYQNRFKYADKWQTMGVRNESVDTLIIDKFYANPEQDWERIKEKLPMFERILNKFNSLINPSLFSTNSQLIIEIASILSIDTEIVLDYPTTLKGTSRLVDLCKHYGATTYLSGLGAKKYLDLDKFKNNDISVVWQDESKMDKRCVLEIIQDLGV